jgi:hypothetical protein
MFIRIYVYHFLSVKGKGNVEVAISLAIADQRKSLFQSIQIGQSDLHGSFNQQTKENKVTVIITYTHIPIAA